MYLYLLESAFGSELYLFISSLTPNIMEEEEPNIFIHDFITYEDKNPYCDNNKLIAIFPDGGVYFVDKKRIVLLKGKYGTEIISQDCNYFAIYKEELVPVSIEWNNKRIIFPEGNWEDF